MIILCTFFDFSSCSRWLDHNGSKSDIACCFLVWPTFKKSLQNTKNLWQPYHQIMWCHPAEKTKTNPRTKTFWIESCLKFKYSPNVKRSKDRCEIDLLIDQFEYFRKWQNWSMYNFLINIYLNCHMYHVEHKTPISKLSGMWQFCTLLHQGWLPAIRRWGGFSAFLVMKIIFFVSQHKL